MAIHPMQMLAVGEFLEKHNASSGIMETFQAICEELVEGQKPTTNTQSTQSECDGCGNPFDEENHVVLCSDCYNMVAS